MNNSNYSECGHVDLRHVAHGDDFEAEIHSPIEIGSLKN